MTEEKEIILRATGSRGDIYQVTVTTRKGRLVMACSCAAGVKGWMCRHKKSLIFGDYEDIYSLKNNNESDVYHALAITRLSGVKKRFIELEGKLKKIEQAYNDSKRFIKAEIGYLVFPPDVFNIPFDASPERMDRIYDFLIDTIEKPE